MKVLAAIFVQSHYTTARRRRKNRQTQYVVETVMYCLSYLCLDLLPVGVHLVPGLWRDTEVLVGVVQVLEPLVHLPAGGIVGLEAQVLVVVHGGLSLGLLQLYLLEPADLGGEPGAQLVVLALDRSESVGALKKNSVS